MQGVGLQWVQFPPGTWGTAPQVDCLCPSANGEPNLARSSPASNGGDPGDQAVSASGARLDNGQVENASDGITSDRFGELYGQALEWSNISGLSNDSTNGVGMVNSGLPSIQGTPNPQSGIMVVVSGTAAV